MMIGPSCAEGAFRITDLPVGTYEVLVSQPGFAPYRHTGIAIQLGSTAHLEILPQSAGVTTQVTVTAQPPAIDPAQTSVSSAVDKERIEELPVQSRNYLNFVLLAPGVSSSAQQPGRRSLAPLPDSGFTFGGLRGRSNNVTIDGLRGSTSVRQCAGMPTGFVGICEINPSGLLREARISCVRWLAAYAMTL
jgi:hypothetical protein